MINKDDIDDLLMNPNKTLNNPIINDMTPNQTIKTSSHRCVDRENETRTENICGDWFRLVLVDNNFWIPIKW